MKLQFHPEAELELIEAALYYELQSPGLGQRFELEVRRATDLLLEHPEMGRPGGHELRLWGTERDAMGAVPVGN